MLCDKLDFAFIKELEQYNGCFTFSHSSFVLYTMEGCLREGENEVTVGRIFFESFKWYKISILNR